MLKFLKISLCVSLIILTLLLGYGAIITVKSEISYPIPQLLCGHNVKRNVISQLYSEKTDDILSNNEYKQLIESELSIAPYKFYIKELSNINGDCNLYFRTITIESSRKGVFFARTFTHEALHLKYLTGDEIYVCYETFKYLYENENKYLHNAGVYYAIDILEHNVAEEYNITNQIMYYFLMEGDDEK